MRMGKYRLENHLKSGGMGAVYRAWDEDLKRWVALKFLKSADDDLARAYFRREAEIAAGLDHPNIAKIYEFGEGRESPYIAMQFIDGETLGVATRERNLEEKLKAVRVVAEAIRFAHERGVIHRDLKPANVMMDRSGHVYVMDFGLAKPAQGSVGTTGIVGTPSYMAPEQAKGRAEPASDVYGIAAILYELVTGRPPFTGASVANVLEQVLDREPIWPRRLSPGTPRDVEAIILKGLEKDVKKRYAGAAQLAEDLEDYLERRPLRHARRPTPLYVLGKKIRRRPLLWTFAAALGVAVVGGVGFGGATLVERSRALTRELRAREAERREAEERERIEREARARAEEQERRARTELARAEEARSRAASESRLAEERLGRAFFLRAQKEAPAFAALLSAHAVAAHPSDLHRADLGLRRSTTSGLSLMLVHDAPVAVARFSPDGSRIATADEQGVVRLWDAKSGEPMGSPIRHEKSVTAMQYHGNRLATASLDGTVQLWTGGMPTILRHEDAVLDLEFSRDGKRLVTGSQDNTARMWDVETGKPIGEPFAHPGFVNDVALSPDGTRLLTRHSRWTLTLWDTVNRRRSTGEFGRVEGMAFRPDGTGFATWEHEGIAQLWNSTDGKPMGQPMRHRGWIGSADFSPDGELLVTGSFDRTARVWNGQTGKAYEEGFVLRPMIHDGELTMVRFSPDGKWIATGSFDKTARVWDERSRWQIGIDMHHEDWVQQVEFSPEGRRLLTVSKGRVVRVWDLGDPPRVEAVGELGATFEAAFSPDGRKLASVGSDAAVRIFDSNTGVPIGKEMKHERQVMSLVWSLDGRLLATRDLEKRISLWNAESGERIGEPVETSTYPFRFSKDGKKLLAVLDPHTFRIWDSASLRVLEEKVDLDDEPALWEIRGDRLIAENAPKPGRWESETGMPVFQGVFDEGGDSVDARFAPGRLLTLTSGEVRLWDSAAKIPLSLPIRYDTGIQGMVVSVDGRRFATASRRVLRFWDGRTGGRVGRELEYGDGFRAMEFSPDGRRLVTGDAKGAVRVWDAERGEPVGPIFTFPNEVYGVRFTSDGRRFAAYGLYRSVWIWALDAPAPSLVETQMRTGIRLDPRGEFEVLPPEDWRVLRGR